MEREIQKGHNIARMVIPRKELDIDLPHDLAIPFLGLNPKELKADICTPLFTAALFTTVKGWKQPKCPWTDELINKWGYIQVHTKEYYSAFKKNNSDRVGMGG